MAEAMPFPSLPSLYTKSRGTVAVSNHRLPVILSPVILSEVEETVVWPTRAEKQVSRLRRSSAVAGDPAALEMTNGIERHDIRQRSTGAINGVAGADCCHRPVGRALREWGTVAFQAVLRVVRLAAASAAAVAAIPAGVARGF